MKCNIEWVAEGKTVRVLDDSLRNYGFSEGQVVPIAPDSDCTGSIPIWTVEGALQARFLRDNGMGWRTAYTSFGYAGEIQYSVGPGRAVVSVGWLPVVEA